MWFYHICSCGRLLPVTNGIIPQHTYTVSMMYGVGPYQYPCDRSGTTHDTLRTA